jgi:valyl-tRNA synthetase
MAAVTETVWFGEKLANFRPGDKTASVMLAPYPVFEKEFDDPSAAAQYEQIIAAVKTSRSLLDAYGLKQDSRRTFKFSLF